MNITKRLHRSGDKIVFYYDFGRTEGHRHSTGIFIYKNPKDQIQKNHNKEALTLLEVKKSQLILAQQATGTAFIPSHKFKKNFLEYYQEYIDQNKRNGNRHLSNSLKQFKLFVKSDFITPIDIISDPIGCASLFRRLSTNPACMFPGNVLYHRRAAKRNKKQRDNLVRAG